MRILPPEAVNTTALSTLRPPAAMQLTPEVQVGASSVSLSGAVRALVAALARTLPDGGALRVQDVLSDADRLLLTWASDFAIAQGFDHAELHKLALDLGGYRLHALARKPHGQATGSPAGSAPAASSSVDEVAVSASARAVLLALPMLSERDESIARAITASLALRDTRIDQGFVRALLDPDRQSARSVDLALVQRLVVALSPSHADGALDPERSFADRDARGLLSRALSALAMAPSELSSVSAERTLQGALLLRARLAIVQPSGPSEGAGAELRTLAQLTRNDRALLALMYATAQSRGSELDAVDGVARALLALRAAERGAAAEQPAARALAPRAVERGAAAAEQPDARAEHLPPRAAGAPHLAASTPATSLSTQATAAPVPSAVLDADPLDRVWSSPTGGASPAPSHAPLEGARDQRDRPPAAGALAEAAEPPLSWWPRGYGSATQLAARLTGSYASVDAGPLPNSFVQGALPGPHAPLGYALAPPLNVAQVLGLSALVAQVHAHSLRTRRLRLWRRRGETIRAVEALHKAADESEAQDVLEGSERRRRAFQALMQRRNRARSLRRSTRLHSLFIQQ